MTSALEKNLAAALNGDVRDHQDINERPEKELKIWLLVRKDIFNNENTEKEKVSEGKLLIQSGHAIGTCMTNTALNNPDKIKTYLSQAQPKISVSVKNVTEMETCVSLCREAGLVTTIVTDAGRTEFGEPTVTFAAVGPCYKEELPKRIQKLQLFKERPFSGSTSE